MRGQKRFLELRLRRVPDPESEQSYIKNAELMLQNVETKTNLQVGYLAAGWRGALQASLSKMDLRIH
jgi:hypothetical protein